MALPSLTTIITSSPTSTKWDPSPTPGGSLTLRSPVTSPTEYKSASLPLQAENPHAFRAPREDASRSPCPALNTLASHGYLPRDGHNITVEQLLAALENPETYHLSHELAEVLARGGLGMLRKLPIFSSPISLHELAKHGLIEHNSSMVHKDTETGNKFAPTRCDTVLLNGLLEDREFLTLDRVAKRRVMLERVSKLDAVHQEIARGEWALVLDVLGRAHGGKVPTEFLRVWLKENRFPDGWKPTHEQGLEDTVRKSREISSKMDEYRTDEEFEKMDAQKYLQEEQLKEELTTTPEEAEAAERRKLASATPNPHPST